nr:MAG TPA: hypothetical protein [Caudoviricetes sp.]
MPLTTPTASHSPRPKFECGDFCCFLLLFVVKYD